VIGGTGRHAIGDTDPQRDLLRVLGEGLLLRKFERVGRDADEIGLVDERQLEMEPWLERPFGRIEDLAKALDEADVRLRDRELRACKNKDDGKKSNRGWDEPATCRRQGRGGELGLRHGHRRLSPCGLSF
jgi:hypothetical protein